MKKLNGLKAALEHVDYCNSNIRPAHILFNVNTNEFLGLMVKDVHCIDKRDVDFGWVDISEICDHFGRKINYSNCREYALALLEERDDVMRASRIISSEYVDDYSKIEAIEHDDNDFTYEEVEESIINVNGCNINFSRVTAIYSDEWKAGRRQGIAITELNELSNDYDGIIFDCDLPCDSYDALCILENNFMITDSKTLNTIKRCKFSN